MKPKALRAGSHGSRSAPDLLTAAAAICVPLYTDGIRQKEIKMNHSNKIWDKEYATSFAEEVRFLHSRQIRYTWVTQNEHGISVWKYKKTVELFHALTEFYETAYYR